MTAPRGASLPAMARLHGSPDTVMVVAAGDPTEIRADLPAADLVVAADGGLGLATALDLPVDILVGDMDSVDPIDAADARRRGVVVERHPRQKNETDLELAIERAVREHPRRVHVVVSAGGMVDHAVVNLAVLASPRWAGVQLTATVGNADVRVVRTVIDLPGDPGERVSLVPVGGPAVGVTTWGLLWHLENATLDPYSGRGLANELVVGPARIEVTDGVLLVIKSPVPSNVPVHARARVRSRSSWTGSRR